MAIGMLSLAKLASDREQSSIRIPAGSVLFGVRIVCWVYNDGVSLGWVKPGGLWLGHRTAEP